MFQYIFRNFNEVFKVFFNETNKELKLANSFNALAFLYAINNPSGRQHGDGSPFGDKINKLVPFLDYKFEGKLG